MARLRSDRITYDAHPLYTLRRRTLIAASIGAALNIIIIFILASSYQNQYRCPFFVISTGLLGGSIAFVSYDLITYGTRETVISASQAEMYGPAVPGVPSPERAWPSKTLLVWDFIIAASLQWLFWNGLSFTTGRSYYDRDGTSETLEAYANLSNFVTSVLHAMAFWKELLARKKTQWKQDLDKEPCENCGHVASRQDEVFANEAVTLGINEQEGLPSQPILTNFGKVGKVALPKWARSATIRHLDDTNGRDVESRAADDGAGVPLLATPEESTKDAGGPSGRYGTMSQSMESLSSVPETIVRKKDKGKRRLVNVE